MTATPIPAGYGIATLKFLRSGADNPDVVTHGYVWGLADESADDDALAIANAWLASFPAADMLIEYTMVGVHVLRKVGATLEAGDKAESVEGTVNAPAAPPAVAARVTKRTALAGRKFRGRMYLPPAFLSDDNVDSAGVIDEATLGSLQTDADLYFDALVAANRAMYLLHLDESAPTLCTSLFVRTTVGTQRRRQAII